MTLELTLSDFVPVLPRQRFRRWRRRVGELVSGAWMNGGFDAFFKIVCRLCDLLKRDERTASNGRDGLQICEGYRVEFTGK